MEKVGKLRKMKDSRGVVRVVGTVQIRRVSRAGRCLGPGEIATWNQIASLGWRETLVRRFTK